MEKENITIGKDFTLWQLIQFVSGPVFTEFALSLLMIVDDGLFISRYVGFHALAAFSLCSPVFFLKNALSNLLCGCGPHCSILLGQQKRQQANIDFTTTCLASVIIGTIVAIIGSFLIRPFLLFLGGSDLTMPYAYPIALLSLWIFPVSLLNGIFARFYVIAGKPQNAMATTLANGFLNIFFDFLFIAKLNYGVYGACITNYISSIAICIFGFVFYCSKHCEVGFVKELNHQPFQLLKTEFAKGIPSMFTSLALAVNTAICNKVVLNIADESYLSAFTIVNNIQFCFMSMIFGLDGAICPMIGYAYGEKNQQRLQKVLKQAITLMALLSCVIIASYYLFYRPLTSLYMTSDYQGPIRETVYLGLKIAPCAFIFFGFNVLATDSLIAMNKTKQSSIITIFENAIFANLCVIVMGYIFGMFGVWFSLAVQEFLCSIVVWIILRQVRKQGIFHE